MWHSDSRGRTVAQSLQQACFKRDKWTCVDCGYVGRPKAGDLNADHIVPRAEGGEDTLENLATRCIPCHEPKTRSESTRGRNAWKRKPERHPGLR